MELAKKLRLKEAPFYLLKAPVELKQLFDGQEVKNSLRGQQPISQVLLFAEQKKVLDEMVPEIVDRLGVDALFWIAYPKKSGSIDSDMSRDDSWGILEKSGYAPVTSVSVDSDWSAVRFRTNEAIGPKLRDTAMADRQIEGVDFVNRKVTLPDDVKKALKPHKHLLKFFDELSFSHKREYIEHIVTAKKPETRARRLDKMVTLLEQNYAKKKK